MITWASVVSSRSTGGVQPAGPGANRSSRCWMASRSRIGSQRANAMTRSYPRNQESGIRNRWGISPESSVLIPDSFCIVVLRSQGSTESKYGVFTSDTSEEGDAHQRRAEPVPGPRCPARDPWQPARICPREAAQHPQRRARRSEAALGGFRRARDAGRAADAVSVSRGRGLSLHGYVQLRADSPLERGARRLGELP